MKQTAIDKIIQHGSVRQKIKLYMTDIALLNCDWNNLDYKIEDKKINIRGTKLLTNEQKTLLFNSIKEAKDVKYYNELRVWNNSFTLFKDKFSIELMRLQAISWTITCHATAEAYKNERTEYVNIILNLIEDSKTQKTVLDKFIELINTDNQQTYWNKIRKPTEIAISTTESCKEFIVAFEIILNKHLPLKPYQDWVQAQKKILEKLIMGIYDLTIMDNTPPDFPKIQRYEDIVAKITELDVEDFKNAGK